MKKIPALLIALFFTLPVMAQKNKGGDTTMVWSICRKAVLFNDLDVAKNALFQIMAMQPGNKQVYDSLAHIYFRMGGYEQAIYAVDQAEPNGALKEIKAYSYRNLGDIKSALPIFEKLYEETGSPENGYQVATMQFTMKRYGECAITAAKVASHADAKTKKVIITTEQGDNMNVSYFAAAENLKGVMFREIGKNELAIEAFQKALTDTPDFTLAKKNLEAVKAAGETAPKPMK